MASAWGEMTTPDPLPDGSDGHGVPPRVEAAPRPDGRRGLVVAVVAGVLLVVAIVVVTVLSGVFLAQHRRAVKSARGELRAYAELLEMYRSRAGRYPRTEEGLEALTKPWPGGAEADFAGMDLTDPWGRPYLYRSDGRTFSVATYGRDGAPGGLGPDADLRRESSTHGVD